MGVPSRLKQIIIILGIAGIFLGLSRKSTAYNTLPRPSFHPNQVITDLHSFDQAATERMVQKALKDDEQRVSHEFDIPTGLDSTVEFWLRVYTVYNSHQLVIYDSIHPEIVYEIVDFRDLASQSRNAIVYEILRERRTKTVMGKYRHAFDRLVQKQVQKHRPKKLSREEEIILAAIKNSPHKHPLSQFRRGLRAQTGQRDHVLRGLALADPLFPRMETLFASMGLAPELTRLVLVESSFNMDAISRAGATGIWQFMPRSAKEYLVVDEAGSIDERLSPLKSTVAAARLLQRNFKTLGSWGLSIIAYNSGTRPVLQFRHMPNKKLGSVIRACGGTRKLGRAGKSYYPSFLAMLRAEAYQDLFFGKAPDFPDTYVRFIPATKNQSARQFAALNSVSLRDLRALNPDIRDFSKRLPRNFLIAVPSTQDELNALITKSRKITLAARSESH